MKKNIFDDEEDKELPKTRREASDRILHVMRRLASSEENQRKYHNGWLPYGLVKKYYIMESNDFERHIEGLVAKGEIRREVGATIGKTGRGKSTQWVRLERGGK